MIEMISPRLTDPTSKSEDIKKQFNYSEDKEFVEELLKKRTKALQLGNLSASKSANSSPAGPGAIGGRGGRGGNAAGGRGGRGIARNASSDSQRSLTPEKLLEPLTPNDKPQESAHVVIANIAPSSPPSPRPIPITPKVITPKVQSSETPQIHSVEVKSATILPVSATSTPTSASSTVIEKSDVNIIAGNNANITLVLFVGVLVNDLEVVRNSWKLKSLVESKFSKKDIDKILNAIGCFNTDIKGYNNIEIYQTVPSSGQSKPDSPIVWHVLGLDNEDATTLKSFFEKVQANKTSSEFQPKSIRSFILQREKVLKSYGGASSPNSPSKKSSSSSKLNSNSAPPHVVASSQSNTSVESSPKKIGFFAAVAKAFSFGAKKENAKPIGNEKSPSSSKTIGSNKNNNSNSSNINSNNSSNSSNSKQNPAKPPVEVVSSPKLNVLKTSNSADITPPQNSVSSPVVSPSSKTNDINENKNVDSSNTSSNLNEKALENQVNSLSLEQKSVHDSPTKALEENQDIDYNKSDIAKESSQEVQALDEIVMGKTNSIQEATSTQSNPIETDSSTEVILEETNQNPNVSIETNVHKIDTIKSTNVNISRSSSSNDVKTSGEGFETSVSLNVDKTSNSISSGETKSNRIDTPKSVNKNISSPSPSPSNSVKSAISSIETSNSSSTNKKINPSTSSNTLKKSTPSLASPSSLNDNSTKITQSANVFETPAKDSISIEKVTVSASTSSSKSPMIKPSNEKLKLPESSPHTPVLEAPKTFDKAYYQALPPEGPIGKDASGLLLFNYSELLRRNFCNELEGLNIYELERHLNNEDFDVIFGTSKVSNITLFFMRYFD